MIHHPSGVVENNEDSYTMPVSQLGTEPLALTGLQTLSVQNDISTEENGLLNPDLAMNTPSKKGSKHFRISTSPNYRKRKIGASLNNA